jgi:translation initiation factor 2 beta subunit (eIF-2beta)/eIF-5
MSDPEFLICLSCESPAYDFEMRLGKLISILCLTCGNDDPQEFVTEAEFEED